MHEETPAPYAPNVHEEQFVRSFVDRSLRERYLYLLSDPRRRQRLLRDWDHKIQLDSRYAQLLAPNNQNRAGIHQLLTEKGAPEICHVMSSYGALDGRDVELMEALNDTVGMGFGTLISCLPGRLCYFEYEDAGLRYILSKK